MTTKEAQHVASQLAVASKMGVWEAVLIEGDMEG